MGADWIRFRVRSEADQAEVRELARFVSEQYPHERWIVTPLAFIEDDAMRARWSIASRRLESLLVFPPVRLHPGDDYSTDQLAEEGSCVALGRSDADCVLQHLCLVRVYVISNNPIFPIEWRDEAYRIILPDELTGYVTKWRGYLEEVRSGQWDRYLHELHWYQEIVREDHRYEQFENLVSYARQSLTRTNAWCLRETLAPVRDTILLFDAFQRLKRLRENATVPRFADAERFEAVTPEQIAREQDLLMLCQEAAIQIKEWNRRVPQNRKVRQPPRPTFDEFLAHAHGTWLETFFAWCDVLVQDGYGLFLWA